MKRGVNVLAVLLLLLGLIWFLQGIGLLQGSFMTGQTQWLLIGLVLLVIGAGLLYGSNRRRPPR